MGLVKSMQAEAEGRGPSVDDDKWVCVDCLRGSYSCAAHSPALGLDESKLLQAPGQSPGTASRRCRALTAICPRRMWQGRFAGALRWPVRYRPSTVATARVLLSAQSGSTPEGEPAELPSPTKR